MDVTHADDVGMRHVHFFFVGEYLHLLFVQIPFDRLLRCLLKFLLQYLYFCYLGLCRQNVVQFQPVLFHYVLEVVSRQSHY